MVHVKSLLLPSIIFFINVWKYATGEMDFHAMLAHARRAQDSKHGQKTTTKESVNLKFGYTEKKWENYDDVQFSHTVLSASQLTALHTTLIHELTHHSFEEMGGRKVQMAGGVPHPSGAILLELPAWLRPLAESLRPAFGGHAPNQVLINVYECGAGIFSHNDGPLYESCAAILSIGSSTLLEFTQPPLPTTLATTSQPPLPTTLATTSQPPLPTTLATTSPSGSTVEFTHNKVPHSMIQPQPLLADTTTPVSTVTLPPFSVFLPANSLVVFTGKAYEHYNHEIVPRTVDVVDNRCINRDACQLTLGDTLPRSSQRFSLTFRRVAHVSKVIDDEFGICSKDDRDEIDRRYAWWKTSITDKRDKNLS